MSKLCKSCKVEKPLSEYYKNKTYIANGVAYYPKSNCKVCHKKKTRDHGRKPEIRRKRKLNDLKPEVKKRKHLDSQKWIKSGKSKAWQRQKRKTDIKFKLVDNNRRRIRYALKGSKKYQS